MIKRNLRQKAVWWEATGRDRYNQTTFNDPVAIDCRWERKQELVKDNEGKEIISRAKVFHINNVSEGDYLYLGSLGDLTEAEQANPFQVAGAYEVKVIGESNSLLSVNSSIKISYLD